MWLSSCCDGCENIPGGGADPLQSPHEHGLCDIQQSQWCYQAPPGPEVVLLLETDHQWGSRLPSILKGKMVGKSSHIISE